MTAPQSSWKARQARQNWWLGIILSPLWVLLVGAGVWHLFSVGQQMRTDPPFDAKTFEAHLRPIEPGNPDLPRMLKFRDNYTVVEEHFQPVLLAATVVGILTCLGAVVYFVWLLRHRAQPAPAIPSAPGSSSSPDTSRSSGMLRWVHWCIVLGGIACTVMILRKMGDVTRAKEPATMHDSVLKFYMIEPASGSPEEAAVVKLRNDYYEMARLWPLLQGVLYGALLYGTWLLAPVLMKWSYRWLGPQSLPPQPPQDIISDSDQASPGISQPER